MSVSEVNLDSYRRQSRRRFTKEFKREVVERLLDTGATVAQLAREHALHPNQLCRWQNEFLSQRQEHARAPERELEAIEFVPIKVHTELKASQTRCTSDLHGDDDIGMRVLLNKSQIQIVHRTHTPYWQRRQCKNTPPPLNAGMGCQTVTTEPISCGRPSAYRR